MKGRTETALVFGGISVARKLTGSGFSLQLVARDREVPKRETGDICLPFPVSTNLIFCPSIGVYVVG